MEQKILAIKGGMQTFFDKEGCAMASTVILGKGSKLIEFAKEGDMVAVSGISKGKGFAGVVKRHHFKGGPRTHGQSDRERAPGSIGSTTTPGRVLKGKRMAGHKGQAKVTIKNMRVLKVDEGENTLYLKGAVPGSKRTLLTIRLAGEKQ